jgi:hypothetical protein
MPVVRAGDPVVGCSNYCHSGGTTGANCGHTVNSVSAQVCTQTGCKSPVIAYTDGNLIQGGDSGSTFSVKNSTSAWARGINIASAVAPRTPRSGAGSPAGSRSPSPLADLHPTSEELRGPGDSGRAPSYSSQNRCRRSADESEVLPGST